MRNDYESTLAKCTDFFEAFTGTKCDRAVAELLTDAALRYYEAAAEGRFSAAELALESTLSYVNTEMTDEEYDAYVDTFEDYLADYD